MKKILLGICAFVCVFSAVAAPVFPGAFQLKPSATQNCSVPSDNTPIFCSQFKSAVTQCAPNGMGMQAIYNDMIAVYGGAQPFPTGLKNACIQEAKLYGGTVQGCIDQWTCYWVGGQDSQGGECDGSGNQCDTCSGPYCP